MRRKSGTIGGASVPAISRGMGRRGVRPLDILYRLRSSRRGVARCPCSRPLFFSGCAISRTGVCTGFPPHDTLAVSRVRTLFRRAAGTRLDSRYSARNDVIWNAHWAAQNAQQRIRSLHRRRLPSPAAVTGPISGNLRICRHETLLCAESRRAGNALDGNN